MAEIVKFPGRKPSAEIGVMPLVLLAASIDDATPGYVLFKFNRSPSKEEIEFMYDSLGRAAHFAHLQGMKEEVEDDGA